MDRPSKGIKTDNANKRMAQIRRETTHASPVTKTAHSSRQSSQSSSTLPDSTAQSSLQSSSTLPDSTAQSSSQSSSTLPDSTTQSASQSSSTLPDSTAQPSSNAASSSIPFERDDSDLDNINKALHKKDLFLGNPTLLEKVRWADFGRQWVLVTKETVEEGVQPETAVLEWVGEISPHNFWLYACTGWNGERGPRGDWEKPSPFESAKARATIRSPSQHIFAEDWKACIQNLQDILTLVKKPDSKTALSVIQHDEIKVRHSIFELKEKDNEGDDDSNGSDLSPEFSIEKWPCKFERATDALRQIKKAGIYDVSPLPATTTNGKPVLPSEYEKRLAGATVLIRITLTSDMFSKGYQFYADIQSISILRPPKVAVPKSPMKSPSKKRRFDVPDFVQESRRKYSVKLDDM